MTESKVTAEIISETDIELMLYLVMKDMLVYLGGTGSEGHLVFLSK